VSGEVEELREAVEGLERSMERSRKMGVDVHPLVEATAAAARRLLEFLETGRPEHYARFLEILGEAVED